MRPDGRNLQKLNSDAKTTNRTTDSGPMPESNSQSAPMGWLAPAPRWLSTTEFSVVE